MKKTKILVYVREYFKDVYIPMFSSLSQYEVIYLTDFPTKGMKNIRDSFNKFITSGSEVESSDLDIDDVIARCRLLRNIDRAHAEKMVFAMQKTIENIIDDTYCMVFGQMVDDYITHLISLISRKRKIKYFGLCNSYFSGCTQVTSGNDGSPAEVRWVTRCEAQERLNEINSVDFRQNYLQSSSYNYLVHLKGVLRYKAKVGLFPLLKFYRRDPFNYHYMVQPYVGQPKFFTSYVNKSLFHENWEQLIRESPTNLVYLPLNFTPEATTDYWIKDTDLIDYEKKIIEIIYYLSKKFKVVVKEHVHMLGIRNKKFYSRLSSMPNVISVPPAVNSNYLLLTYKPILFVGGGSVGIEATIRKISVVTYCSTSYWAGSSDAIQTNLNSNDGIANSIKLARPTSGDLVSFMQSCLSSMFSFDYLSGNTLVGEQLQEMVNFIERERHQLTACQ